MSHDLLCATLSLARQTTYTYGYNREHTTYARPDTQNSLIFSYLIKDQNSGLKMDIAGDNVPLNSSIHYFSLNLTSVAHFAEIVHSTSMQNEENYSQELLSRIFFLIK